MRLSPLHLNKGIIMAVNLIEAKTVVITGASTGIGEACALYLDNLGWRVFAGIRKQVDGAALQQKASARLQPVFMEVTDIDSIRTAATFIAAEVGDRGLAGLVNNAGIAAGGPLEFLPVDRLREQLEINVVGQVSVIQSFLPLVRQGQGRIINMGSISGRVAMPFFGPYAASKFALEALNDSLRVELREWGLEVIIIEPGAIATPIWEKSVSKADALVDTLPDQAKNLYGSLLSRLRHEVIRTGQKGIPAIEVAKVLHKALVSKRPKTRYLVGRDARMAAFLVKFLPDRLRDWFIMHPFW
jgi:NAD(P)-dependent dehydrogenase (short-subunit alcohol dehydrogenase family)